MARYTVSSRVNLDGDTEFFTTVGDDQVTVVARDYLDAAAELWAQCKDREAKQAAVVAAGTLDTSDLQPETEHGKSTA